MNLWPTKLKAAVRALIQPRQQPYAETSWSIGGYPRVLFSSGADGAPLRYRVIHQIEQLTLQGISSASYGDMDPHLCKHVSACDVLYLYRARNTSVVQEAVAIAHAQGKPVVFDTDDMIWDQRLVEYCCLDQRYTPPEVEGFREFFRQTEALMQLADVYVVSTPYLADMLRVHFGKPVHVNANAMSQEALDLSKPLYRQRMQSRPRERVTIGYFSGWHKAHEEDFAIAAPAVIEVLKTYPHVNLRIVGHFDTSMLPDSLQQQVEVAPFVAWEQLSQNIAAVDINLAPIVDNPHRRSKSAVKFLEAALVGVPTVASDLEPYRDIIPGHSGFLASSSEEWYAGLVVLATSFERRRDVGRAAHDQVLAQDTTRARAQHFVSILHDIVP